MKTGSANALIWTPLTSRCFTSLFTLYSWTVYKIKVERLIAWFISSLTGWNIVGSIHDGGGGTGSCNQLHPVSCQVWWLRSLIVSGGSPLLMRTEQSVVRGSVVCHEQMEPLRGQINLSEVTDYTPVNFTSDHSFSPSSSIQNTDQSSSTRRTPENSHNGRDNDIFSNIVFRDSSVLANGDCRESEPLIPSTPNSTLTSLDIATLRKNLSGRPRLRRVCHICGRECPSRHKLQRHLSTHSEERPYNCKVCGKAFKWTEYLSKHMRTQHGSSSTDGKFEV